MSRTTRMMAFTSASSGSVPSALPTISAYDVQADATATASLTFNTDGTITGVGNSGVTGGNWFNPTTTSIGNSYWVKVVVSVGSITGMTSGTWVQLTSAQTMTRTRVTVGINSASGTYFISTGGTDGTIIGDADGGDWSISAEST